MKLEDIALALAFILIPYSIPALIWIDLKLLAWLLGPGC